MTRIYGCSDDLIEFDGDFSGEVGVRADDDEKEGTLIVCSDGTVLDVKYGKGGRGIWQVTLLRKGDMLDREDAVFDAVARIRTLRKKEADGNLCWKSKYEGLIDAFEMLTEILVRRGGGE